MTSNPLRRLSHCPTEAGRRGAEAAVKRLARRSTGAFDLPLLGGKRVACRAVAWERMQRGVVDHDYHPKPPPPVKVKETIRRSLSYLRTRPRPRLP